MNITPIETQNQTDISGRVEIFGGYFSRFKISSMMKRAGIVGGGPQKLDNVISSESTRIERSYL